MKEREEAASEGDGKHEEYREQPREAVGTVRRTTSNKEEDDASDKTDCSNAAGDHHWECELTFIKVLPFSGNVFRVDEMSHDIKQ